MKHFLDITVATGAKDYLRTLSERSLVVYSPSALRLLKIAPRSGTFISTHDIGKDARTIKEFCESRHIDTVVSLGGGTAIDIGKYIGSLTGCRFTCIPTALSTNAFATNKVALMKGSSKVTLDAQLADKIILDATLIKAAGAYNLYGLCDILSIHTALYDWRLAESAGVEEIDRRLYEQSHDLLTSATRLAMGLAEPGELDMSSLFTMIGESGHITNLYGSGRPESGSEHIFAKELERRVVIPHGISIAIGITVMSQLQGNYSDDVQAALRQIGVMADIADGYDLRETIHLSLMNILPREDRYTILNERLPSIDESSELTDMLFTEIQGAANEYSNH